MKSVAAITVFIAENPAPVSGSKSERRTDSCCRRSRLLRQTMPASRNVAPKPTIVWWLTEVSMRKVAVSEVVGIHRSDGFSANRSPALEETKTRTSGACARASPHQAMATINAIRVAASTAVICITQMSCGLYKLPSAEAKPERQGLSCCRFQLSHKTKEHPHEEEGPCRHLLDAHRDSRTFGGAPGAHEQRRGRQVDRFLSRRLVDAQERAGDDDPRSACRPPGCPRGPVRLHSSGQCLHRTAAG